MRDRQERAHVPNKTRAIRTRSSMSSHEKGLGIGIVLVTAIDSVKDKIVLRLAYMCHDDGLNERRV